MAKRPLDIETRFAPHINMGDANYTSLRGPLGHVWALLSWTEDMKCNDSHESTIDVGPEPAAY
jgi:hypothetical protein